MRSVLWCGAVLVLGTALGCGGEAGKSGGGGSGGKSVAELRQELSDTTKRMDGGMAEAVEYNVKYFEGGNSGWGWSNLDEQILQSPNFSAETKAAYKRWRDAKVAEEKAKKK